MSSVKTILFVYKLGFYRQGHKDICSYIENHMWNHDCHKFYSGSFEWLPIHHYSNKMLVIYWKPEVGSKSNHHMNETAGVKENTIWLSRSVQTFEWLQYVWMLIKYYV